MCDEALPSSLPSPTSWLQIQALKRWYVVYFAQGPVLGATAWNHTYSFTLVSDTTFTATASWDSFNRDYVMVCKHPKIFTSPGKKFQPIVWWQTVIIPIIEFLPSFLISALFPPKHSSQLRTNLKISFNLERSSCSGVQEWSFFWCICMYVGMCLSVPPSLERCTIPLAQSVVQIQIILMFACRLWSFVLYDLMWMAKTFPILISSSVKNRSINTNRRYYLG